MKNFRIWLVVYLSVVLAGCVSVVKVESGSRTVGERMQLTLDGAWNQISAPNIAGPNCETWTMEGLPIDKLLIYSGLKNDEPIHAVTPSISDSEKKIFKFHSDMPADQIVALFEGMLTRDGSTFTLNKLEPAPFGGGKGFHFEYGLIRKSDNVLLLGMGSAIISKGELFAIVYQAPRLVFYKRQEARVTQIMNSARIKGEEMGLATRAPQILDAEPKPKTVSAAKALNLVDETPIVPAVAKIEPRAKQPTTEVILVTQKPNDVPTASTVTNRPLTVTRPPDQQMLPVASVARKSTTEYAVSDTAKNMPIAANTKSSIGIPATVLATTERGNASPAQETSRIVVSQPSPSVISVSNAIVDSNINAGATSNDNNISSPTEVQTVEFKLGASSNTVERLGKAHGCESKQGASLITSTGPVEVYRMSCLNGTVYLAKCELRQCVPMRSY